MFAAKYLCLHKLLLITFGAFEPPPPRAENDAVKTVRAGLTLKHTFPRPPAGQPVTLVDVSFTGRRGGNSPARTGQMIPSPDRGQAAHYPPLLLYWTNSGRVISAARAGRELQAGQKLQAIQYSISVSSGKC